MNITYQNVFEAETLIGRFRRFGLSDFCKGTEIYTVQIYEGSNKAFNNNITLPYLPHKILGRRQDISF